MLFNQKNSQKTKEHAILQEELRISQQRIVALENDFELLSSQKR